MRGHMVESRAADLHTRCYNGTTGHVLQAESGVREKYDTASCPTVVVWCPASSPPRERSAMRRALHTTVYPSTRLVATSTATASTSPATATMRWMDCLLVTLLASSVMGTI